MAAVDVSIDTSAWRGGRSLDNALYSDGPPSSRSGSLSSDPEAEQLAATLAARGLIDPALLAGGKMAVVLRVFMTVDGLSAEQLLAGYVAEAGKPLTRRRKGDPRLRRPCAHCGREFTVVGSQRFCGKPCRRAVTNAVKRERKQEAAQASG